MAKTHFQFGHKPMKKSWTLSEVDKEREYKRAGYIFLSIFLIMIIMLILILRNH